MNREVVRLGDADELPHPLERCDPAAGQVVAVLENQEPGRRPVPARWLDGVLDLPPRQDSRLSWDWAGEGAG